MSSTESAPSRVVAYSNSVPTPLFERLAKAAHPLAGFGVSGRVVVGNFSYAKLPMVLDLETATDALLVSDLICAVAGDEAARDSVRARHPNVTLSEPDATPPWDEFLVLDADASQSYAINAAVGGADLVIDGPPGTGKSQTIANLIATLAARGSGDLLFVAESVRRSTPCWTASLGSGSASSCWICTRVLGRSELASDLSRALASAASLPRPDMTAAQETLVRRRSGLLSIPVLAGSAAYAFGESQGWKCSLENKPWEAIGFYSVIGAATLLGIGIDFSGFDPMKALFWSAVINGFVAVPVMAAMMYLASRRDQMGRFTVTTLPLILGWLTTILMGTAAIAMLVV